jgi:hypothetical protein
MSDKIIVTDRGALQLRYGPAGYLSIQQALNQLITADSVRGITTVVVEIDDPSQIAPFGTAPVATPSSESATKAATNAILNARNPDYLMIVGGPDIVCHQTLNNPMTGDGDPNVPSDLPYASTSAFSQVIAQHLGTTHVVGRLPDIPNAQNPSMSAPNPQNPQFLLDLINRAAQSQTRQASLYQSCFGLSAQVWSVSTQMSLAAAFGGTPSVLLAPPVGPPIAANFLQPLSHFINCHGAQADFHFYGQRGNQYPIAMESPDIVAKIQDGSVVAAECCYGAEIYDPALAGDMGLCCRYLAEGAYGFFGSTTIAYGPVASNSSADLIAQYFLNAVVATGASTGRACLDARQRFVQAAGPILSNPDLKTIGQYLLLGDPSLHPATTPPSAAATAAASVVGPQEATEAERTSQRQALVAKGSALPRAVLYPHETPTSPPPPPVRQRLIDIAARVGIVAPEITSYEVDGDAAMLANAKAFGGVPTIHVMIRRLTPVGPVIPVRALIVHQFDGRLVPKQDLWSH